MSHDDQLESPTVYDALNERVLSCVPLSAERILDVGCGTGRLGAKLKARQLCHVTGITYAFEEARVARQHLDEVLQADLNDFQGLGERAAFDAVVLSHVLEHIRCPETLLGRLIAHVVPEGRVVVALPNVLWWRQRLEFMRGRFRYTESGIMDCTHVHFFDLRSARQAIEVSGLTVLRFETSGGFPGSRFFGRIREPVDRLATKALPGLFGVEFIFVCRPASASEL